MVTYSIVISIISCWEIAMASGESIKAALHYLRTGLESEQWPRGSCLPEVRHMARDASVSTASMCEAIAQLKSEGLLYACKGKGTLLISNKQGG